MALITDELTKGFYSLGNKVTQLAARLYPSVWALPLSKIVHKFMKKKQKTKN